MPCQTTRQSHWFALVRASLGASLRASLGARLGAVMGAIATPPF